MGQIASQGRAMVEEGKRLVGIQELSVYLSVPVGTLYQWVSQRRIPYVKLGRSTRFDLQEIDIWVKKQSVKSSGTEV